MLFKKLKRAEKDVAFLRYPSNIAKRGKGADGRTIYDTHCRRACRVSFGYREELTVLIDGEPNYVISLLEMSVALSLSVSRNFTLV